MQQPTEAASAPARAQSTKVLLRVTALKVAYGGIHAVKGVSFEVMEGELVSLIGANGAGKTTTLKAITGTQASAGAFAARGRGISSSRAS
jgi:branched-chain amino acid transport system ATP-binding protein